MPIPASRSSRSADGTPRCRIWMENLPADCDLNHLEVLADGEPGIPIYVGPADSKGLQQVNAWLPDRVRTGLVPVELRADGQPLCPPAIARMIPSGPLVPRIVSVTDGVNLVQDEHQYSGSAEDSIEEVSASGIDQRARGWTAGSEARVSSGLIRAPPRHELNLELPHGLSPGTHTLQIRVGPRRVLSANIVVRS